MNKIITSSVAISLLGVSLVAGPRVEVTPMLSKKVYNYNSGVDAPRLDDGELQLGLRANAYIFPKAPRVSVQAGIDASKDNAMGDGGKTDIERGMLSVQYDIPTKGKLSKVTPYVFGGGGYEKLHRSIASQNVDSQAFYNVGGGLRYAINSRVDLVGEGRWIKKVEDRDDDALIGIGVGYKFGEASYGKSKLLEGTSLKAMSLKELAAKTPKKDEKVEPVAPVVETPVVTAPSEPEIVTQGEVIDTRIEYDSGYVDMCDDTASSEDSVESTSEIQGYYVQVIALRKNSPDVIISRLTAKGYDYHLKGEGDLTRVLVGPYESRSAARSALRKLKKIRRDAFIYHAQ